MKRNRTDRGGQEEGRGGKGMTEKRTERKEQYIQTGTECNIIDRDKTDCSNPADRNTLICCREYHTHLEGRHNAYAGHFTGINLHCLYLILQEPQTAVPILEQKSQNKRDKNCY